MAETLIGACGALIAVAYNALEGWVFTTTSMSTTGTNNENNDESSSWRINPLFVLEATMFNTTLFALAVAFWLFNRQTHARDTRGSTIIHQSLKHLLDEDLLDDGEFEEDQDSQDGGFQVVDPSEEGEEIPERNSRIRSPEAQRKKSKQRESYVRIATLSTEEDDDDGHDDEIVGNNDKDETHNSQISIIEQKPQQQKSKKRGINFNPAGSSLMEIMKTLPVFSYLNEDALKIAFQHVEYVDLNQGQSLFDRNNCDGSLYTVVYGEVKVHFHDFLLPEDEHDLPSDDESESNMQGGGPRPVSITCKPGDVVTSFLMMLLGMTQDIDEISSSSSSTQSRPPLPFANGVSAVASAPNTRLLHISPKCFAAVLEKFPADVYRLAQTILGRAQRLTVLTLVGMLGLRKELIDIPSSNKVKDDEQIWHLLGKELNQSNHGENKRIWESISSNIQAHDMSIPEQNEIVKSEAVTMAMRLLGIQGTSEIENAGLLRKESEIISLTPGETLLQTGSATHATYLLLNGRLEIGLALPSKRPTLSNPDVPWSFHSQNVVSPGYFAGLHSCMTGEVDLFNVRCAMGGSDDDEQKDGCTLLKIPKNTFDELVSKHPQVLTKCLSTVMSMISPAVHLVNWTSEFKSLEASEYIAECGDPSKSIFLILNGRLRAVHPRSSVSKGTDGCIKEFGRGQCVGDVGCLTQSPWPCNVYAIRHSDIFVVPMKTLVAVVQAFPSAGLHFARTIASGVQPRLAANNRKEFRQSNSTISSRVSIPRMPAAVSPSLLPSYGLKLATVAVVPLNADLGVSFPDFCNVLVSSFKNIAPTKLVTKGMVQSELGEKVFKSKTAIRDLKMTQFMADLEEHNRLVVYQADLKVTWWSKICIQQADCILLVANADTVPEKRPIEDFLAWAYESMDVRIDLVVAGKQKMDDGDDADEYHEEMNVSDQLNNWSEERGWIAGHHLVRTPFQRHDIDFCRMCRRLTGRSVGLVLGAGGARGLSQLGVIKALKEAGVTIDLVGGTSQGAFCGALYAKQPDDFELLMKKSRKMADTMASMKEKLFDLTLPLASIFSANRFNAGIRRALGTARIQDLVLNYFCITVDIQKRRAVVHRKGILWRYVRASMSLTGYLPPLSEDGSLLIDGGYLNACPADVMRDQMGAKTVIAVDVAGESARSYFDYGDTLSGWWLLWNSWNPFVETVRVPSWGDISNMTMWVSSDQHLTKTKEACDLYLKPPLANVATLDYGRFDEIVEIGYKYAKPRVDEYVKQNPWLVDGSRTRKKHHS